MISIRLRQRYRRLSYLMGSSRDLRPGMQGWMPLAWRASLNQSASYPRSLSSHCAFVRSSSRGCHAGIIAHLTCGHEEARRAAIGIADGVKFGVHTALRAADQAARLPF
jgi:hypothetical protein